MVKGVITHILQYLVHHNANKDIICYLKFVSVRRVITHILQYIMHHKANEDLIFYLNFKTIVLDFRTLAHGLIMDPFNKMWK